MLTKKSTIIFTLFFTFFFLLYPNPFQEESLEKSAEVQIIAHRGASGIAPENTIAAFDKAIALKVDFIEFDVQRSMDGKLVVIHDTTVDRTTNGTGNVKDLTYAELKELDAGSWKDSPFEGEKIPCFEEVFNRYVGKVGLLIEVKAPHLYPGIEEQLAEFIMERQLDQAIQDQIIIQSFNHDSLKKLKQLLPTIPVAVLTNKKTQTTERALKEIASFADYINPDYKLLTKNLFHHADLQGIKITPWTVRNQQEAQFVSEMNISAIITDYLD